MIRIRPVSDLRNKFPEIEDIVVKEEQPVYLTKNGHGSMVVLLWARIIGRNTDNVFSSKKRKKKRFK